MNLLATATGLLAQNNGNAAGGLFALGIPCVLGLLIFGLFLWALIDCIQNTRLQGNMKLIWILVIIFTSPIGPILYLIIGRKQ